MTREHLEALGDLPADLEHYLEVEGVSKALPGAPGVRRPPVTPPAARPVQRLTRAPFRLTPYTSSAAASVQVLPANAERNYLRIQNHDAVQTIRYNLGASAELGLGIEVPPGASEVFDVVVPTNSLHVYTPSASMSYSIVEG